MTEFVDCGKHIAAGEANRIRFQVFPLEIVPYPEESEKSRFHLIFVFSK